MTVEALQQYASTHLRWYGAATIRIVSETGPILFVDPAGLPADPGTADLVLITHPHFDHCDRRSLSAIRRPATLVVAPESSVRGELAWLQGAQSMSEGQSRTFGGVTVSALPAYNLSKPFHPRSKGWLGYLIEVDGLRIYHAGDTDCIPEMRELRPDIALLPVGGFFGMDVSGAAEAVALLRSSLTIPMHFGLILGGRRAGERLKAKVGSACMVLTRASGS